MKTINEEGALFMNKRWYGILLCTTSFLLSNMGPQGFGSFLNHYFVETGTFNGESLLKALHVGFQEAYSIESDKDLYENVRQRLARIPNVHIYYGDSSQELWNIIKALDKPITFWLDAHTFPPRYDGEKNCPLLEELEQIKQHPIKTHTILIDDMHCAGTAAFDFLTKEDLIQKIREINPEYQITYVPGGDEGEYPENVMVAYLPEQ
jgi:hypothetical protein